MRTLFPGHQKWREFAGSGRNVSAMVSTILAALLVLLICGPVYAARVTYPGCRKFVEERCATNTTPQDERVFVIAAGSPSIVRFHQGITLREIIDQTSFKGKTAWISVLRADHPILDDKTRVGRKESPKSEVKPLDLIVISGTADIINT